MVKANLGRKKRRLNQKKWDKRTSSRVRKSATNSFKTRDWKPRIATSSTDTHRSSQRPNQLALISSPTRPKHLRMMIQFSINQSKTLLIKCSRDTEDGTVKETTQMKSLNKSNSKNPLKGLTQPWKTKAVPPGRCRKLSSPSYSTSCQ